MVILTIPWLGFKYYCYHFRFRRPAKFYKCAGLELFWLSML